MGNPYDNQGGSPRKSRDDSRSDLFSVGRSDSQIPQIKEIPETPEERRRRRQVRIITVSVASVLTVTAAVIAFFLWSAAAKRSAVHEVSDEGRAASVDDALEHLEGDDEAGLRSMVLAIGALELRRSPDEARALVEQLSKRDTVPLSARVAETYLALYAGEPTRAWKVAGRIAPAGTYAGEAAHAVARSALATGNTQQALKSARVAVEQRSDAPRHAALLALITERTDSDKEALAALKAFEGDDGSPATRIARARIVFEPRTDMNEALELASGVLGDEVATPPEKAWAHLLQARAEAEGGEGAKAAEALDAALETRPPGSEAFTLLVIETLLRASQIQRAAETFEELPSDASTDAGRRAQLGGWLALEQGKASKAASRLEKATDSPWTTFLRARVREAHKDYDEAARLYRTAAKGPGLMVEASTRLAAMELERGNADAALSLAERVLEKSPHDPSAVPVAVRAKIEKGQTDAAMKLARGALKEHPGDPRLLAARAQVEMANEQWEQALSTLQTATDKQPDDADLQASLGEAGRHLGKDDIAREAFDAALEIAPSHSVALVGRFELAVADEEPDLAGELLERIDESDLVSNRIDRARARYFVLTGAGQDAVKTVRFAIMRRGEEDPVLWLALGKLQMQAERFGGAAQAFSRVQRYDEGNLEAKVWQAITQVWQRRSAPAERTLGEAEELAEGKEDVEPRLRALMLVAEGWLRYADELWGAANRLARRAIEIDARSSEAHMLLASVDRERDKDATEHLEAALEARAPRPEAKGLLAASRDEPTEGNCELARAYVDAAPSGRHGRRVRRFLRKCD